MSLPRRLLRLEELLSNAAPKPTDLRKMTDAELWAVILDDEGQPVTRENITRHEAYNADCMDAVWVDRDGTWVNIIRTAKGESAYA